MKQTGSKRSHTILESARIRRHSAKFGQTASLSAAEQSGINHASDDILEALAKETNSISKPLALFLSCAQGKRADEMLALSKRGLKSRDQELRIAAGEQSQISWLRMIAF